MICNLDTRNKLRTQICKDGEKKLQDNYLGRNKAISSFNHSMITEFVRDWNSELFRLIRRISWFGKGGAGFERELALQFVHYMERFLVLMYCLLPVTAEALAQMMERGHP